jgi:hypothetical protein
MTAVFCTNTADRKGETWAEQLVPFTRLEFAASDAAKGITKAVTRVAEARRDDPGAPALEHGRDLFHTAMEARRVLARHWRRAEAAWERAEAADVQVADAKRRGLDARGVAQAGRPRRVGASDHVVGADRAARIGLGALPRRPGAVPPRRPAQRPRPCRGRDRRGVEGPDRPRLVEGPRPPERPAEPDLPGPDAPAVGGGRAASRVA